MPDAQQPQQLTASAAEVQYGCARAEVVDVSALAFADRVDAAAHPALEGEVIRHCRRGRLGRDGGGSLRRARGTSPLEPREPLLQLADEPLGLLAPGSRGICPLGERVDELEDRVVEHALVGGQRLHVPAHELSQHTLGESLEPTTRFPLGADRPEALGESTIRRKLGSRRGPGPRSTPELLAEAIEQGGDIDLLT